MSAAARAVQPRTARTAVTAAVVLAAAGAVSMLVGYLRHGRKVRKIRNARYVSSASQIRARMRTEKNIFRSESYFKLHGLTDCENPIIAPLSRLRAVHAVCRAEILTTSWAPKALRWLFRPSFLSAVVVPRDNIKEKVLETPWRLKLPDGSLVDVLTEGAEWVLEDTVRETHAISAPLPPPAGASSSNGYDRPEARGKGGRGSDGGANANAQAAPGAPPAPAPPPRPSRFGPLGRLLFPSTVYTFTKESLLRHEHPVLVLGHVDDHSPARGGGAGFEDDEGYYYHADACEARRAQYNPGRRPPPPPAPPQPRLVVSKPTVRWFLISGVSEETLINSLEWKWRAWSAAGAVCFGAAAGILIVR